MYLIKEVLQNTLGTGFLLFRDNELGSGVNKQFNLATSTAVVIVVCFTIWNFF
jgi:hypothetical protein